MNVSFGSEKYYVFLLIRMVIICIKTKLILCVVKNRKNLYVTDFSLILASF